MKFIVDKEAQEALLQLCDIALKQGGLGNFNSIQKVIESVEEYKEDTQE